MALVVWMPKLKCCTYILAAVATFVFANVWYLIGHGGFAWANGIGALINALIGSSVILFFAFISVLPITVRIDRNDDLDNADRLLLYFFSMVLVFALAALIMYVLGDFPEIVPERVSVLS